GLNVLDNVRLAGQLRARHGLVHTMIRSRRYLTQKAEIRRKACDLLGLFGLQDRADEPADSLSYGHQRHLEIVRALAAGSTGLVLDQTAGRVSSPAEARP